MNPLRAGLVISVMLGLAGDALIYYLATSGDDYIALVPRMLLVAALLSDTAASSVRWSKSLYVKGSARRTQVAALWRRVTLFSMALDVLLAFVAVSYGLGFFFVVAVIDLATAAWYFFRDKDGWPPLRNGIVRVARSVAASLRPPAPVPARS